MHLVNVSVKITDRPAYFHKKLLNQKNKKIIYRLAQPGASVKEIVYEFGFSSAASFNKYCKKNFGNSPRELVRQLKDKHIDKQNLKI